MNRRHAPVLAAIALLCLTLSACGNKGPLVLPDRPDDAAASSQTAPADGAKTSDRR